jgi:serine phosphatase RsbU (regulator of sigma subunit)
VLGRFKDWKCGVEEVSLRPGDVLLIYTDGITEAPDPAGEEFGESRLLEILRSRPRAPVEALLKDQAVLYEMLILSARICRAPRVRRTKKYRPTF